MSSNALDKESWKRAWGPATRTFGYITGIYVLIFLIINVPVYILLSLGAPAVLGEVANYIMVLAFVFAFFLAFFKVLDEERPGIQPLNLVK